MLVKFVLTGQNTVIGIAVGMFLVGLAFGYVAFAGSTHSGNMMISNQQAMMNDPQFSEQMMEQILENPEIRNQMMESITQDPAPQVGSAYLARAGWRQSSSWPTVSIPVAPERSLVAADLRQASSAGS